MKLYLIRHGETVDNVAGLYAGVTDSRLTIHGVEQSRRLGEYFIKQDVKLTHIFASPLSRAHKTAEALLNAQQGSQIVADRMPKLDITTVSDLIEQDFGFYERKPFYARSDPKKSGREAHYDKHRNDTGFVDVESKESMAKRADAFLDQHLVPLLKKIDEDDDLTVAVVSHGILLSNLWRRLLLRLPRKSLTIASGVTAARDNLVLEHLGGWSNTGYLELMLSKERVAGPDEAAQSSPTTVVQEASSSPASTAEVTKVVDVVATPEESAASEGKGNQTSPSLTKVLYGYATTLVAVDSKQHLVGLKRQRGGIGRLAHDEGQKKLDGFFKRQKMG